MDSDAPLSPAGYLRALHAIFDGVTSTTGEIDDETGEFIGWDEPPFTFTFLNPDPVDEEIARRIRFAYGWYEPPLPDHHLGATITRDGQGRVHIRQVFG